MPAIIEQTLVMKEYGWTEADYDDQSEEITSAIRARRQVEYDVRKRQNQELERQMQRSKNS